MHGHLKASRAVSKEEDILIGEIFAGEVVGEIALLIQEKRSATIQATRDSVLLKITQKHFYDLSIEHPDIILAITKACLDRFFKTSPRHTASTSCRTIALIPAGHNSHFKQFVSEFIEELSKQAKVLHLDSSSQMPTPNWLAKQESLHEFIIYESDQKLTNWSRFCLKEADRCLFIGFAEESPDLNEIEMIFFKSNESHYLFKNLVLLYPASTSSPQHSPRWVSARNQIDYYNLRISFTRDLHRLIRFLSGKALGLVLSGGGARGLAHVGVIKALEELNIPIDYIAGSSIGSIVGGAYAVYRDAQALKDCIPNILIPSIESIDYTLPLLSLRSGEGITNGIKEAVGEHRHIEQCWINFFCVSTNLSSSSIEVHTRGLLWEGIRASLALPGIFPPLVNQKHEVLIDGAIMNNLPVDIMKSYIAGGQVIASSILSGPTGIHCDLLGSTISGWDLLKKQLLPGSSKAAPYIGDIISSAIMLGSLKHRQKMEKLADRCIEIPVEKFGMLDFKSYEEIIQIGYETTLKHFQDAPYTP